jgi:hypothetical protein
MKALLIAMVMVISAQTFASNCDLPNKHKAISAKKITCDETTGQVKIEGIKIEKFGEKKNIVIRPADDYQYLENLRAGSICTLFDLGKIESHELYTFFSLVTTGIAIQGRNDELYLDEQSQGAEAVPVKSVICNRKN